MSAVLSWAGDDEGLPTQALVHPSRSRARRSRPGVLPPGIEQAVWRACDLGAQAGEVVSSGFEALDAELPGGGWPCRSIAEVLSVQPSVLEWRVIGPALRAIVAAGRHVVVVGPPKTPHLPGLRHGGLDAQPLGWVQADTPAERLWCTEQLVKSGACGALLAWLPQARPEQIRRLQVCAQACAGPVFLFRPAAAQHEASAASLRVMAGFALDWEIQLQVLKRRGPAHEGVVRLRSVPGGLEAVLTPRLQTPSRLVATREGAPREATDQAPAHPNPPGGTRSPVVQPAAVHALGSATPSARARRRATVR